MRRKKRRSKTLTFTILSNDANKIVTRFRLPKIFLYIMSVLILVPVLLLFYYVNVYNHQQKENAHLSAQLSLQTTKADGLQIKVDHLKEKTTKVQSKMNQLARLESEIRGYLTELPESVNPSGGIRVTLPEGKGTQSKGSNSLELRSSKLIEQYEKTITRIEETNSRLLHIPTIWPTTSHIISSSYGGRSDPIHGGSAFHTGLDLAVNIGSPVYAGANGKVIKAEYYGGYGKAIIIRHSNTYKTLYGHLSQINVHEGETVKKGAIIGLSGNTGRSTGPHLHYEILKFGKPIDPLPYVNFFKDNSSYTNLLLGKETVKDESQKN